MSDPNVNEQNMTPSDYQSATPQDSWTPPNLPDDMRSEDEEPIPEMSEVQTLTSIFFEPSRTFDSFRRKPRFLLALLIMIVVATGYLALYLQKVGYENIVRATMESSPQAEQMSQEQKEQNIKIQMHPAVKAIWYVSPTLVFILATIIGSLVYMAGVKLMGGNIGYFQSVSVWTYSWFPPVVISSLLNILLLFIKSPDSYDIVMGLNGLVQANPGFLVSVKKSPVLFTLLSSFDVFRFFGFILAAIGLRVVGKISAGFAWSIVLGFWVFLTAVSILLASLR